MQHVFEGVVTPAHKARSPFLYLPFPVPSGAARINITYSYTGVMSANDHWGGNTLDIGLFGPGGIEFGAGDFRGWSGSFRSSITIGRRDATPAFLPGLPPGEWNVLLGLYNIAEDGSRYRVQVDVLMEDAPPLADTDAHPVAPAPSIDRPAAGPRWYKGDLHCHTFHSDGHCTLRQMTDHAKSRGLDFLAMTDHNTVSHHDFLPSLATPEFLPIPGEEITTYFGHANVWGIRRWVDFRCDTPEKARQAATLAHEQGVLFSINHPKSGGPPWLFGTDLGFDCMEVWQAPWWVSNFESHALWERLLRQGRRIVAVGGSDLHSVDTDTTSAPYPLGSPTTWVYANALSVPEILNGIRQGHVFLSASPAGPLLEFTAESEQASASMGDMLVAPAGEPVHFLLRATGARGLVLRLVGARGLVHETVIDQDQSTYRFSASPESLGAGDVPQPYLRAEVIQPPEVDLESEPAALVVEAMTNPIYLSC